MASPTITDWIQAIGSLAALGLSGLSLLWQWRTARKARGNRLTAEASRVGPEVWRLHLTFEASHRSSPPRLTVKVRNPRPETALVGEGRVPLRPDGYGNRVLDVGAIFDLQPEPSISVEMILNDAPSLQASAQVFVRYPVENEPMKVTLSVGDGLFPAAKKTILLTPLD